LAALGQPYDLSTEVGHSIKLSASIGISRGDRAQQPETLLHDADVALYRAKQSGKSRFARYEPEPTEPAIHDA
jgi:PleD family two-component response regulator